VGMGRVDLQVKNLSFACVIGASKS
jgi:hypothetical protein